MKIKQKKDTTKLINAKDSAHHSQTLIIGTAKIKMFHSFWNLLEV